MVVLYVGNTFTLDVVDDTGSNHMWFELCFVLILRNACAYVLKTCFSGFPELGTKFG